MSHHSPPKNLTFFQSSTTQIFSPSRRRPPKFRRFLRVLQGQIHWTKSSNMCQALTTIAIHLSWRHQNVLWRIVFSVGCFLSRQKKSRCIETVERTQIFNKASTYTGRIRICIYIYTYICRYVHTNNEQMTYTDSYVLQFLLGVYPNISPSSIGPPKNPRYTKFTCHILGLQLQTTAAKLWYPPWN